MRRPVRRGTTCLPTAMLWTPSSRTRRCACVRARQLLACNRARRRILCWVLTRRVSDRSRSWLAAPRSTGWTCARSNRCATATGTGHTQAVRSTGRELLLRVLELRGLRTDSPSPRRLRDRRRTSSLHGAGGVHTREASRAAYLPGAVRRGAQRDGGFHHRALDGAYSPPLTPDATAQQASTPRSSTPGQGDKRRRCSKEPLSPTAPLCGAVLTH
jgi:hypothetical protein